MSAGPAREVVSVDIGIAEDVWNTAILRRVCERACHMDGREQ